jgi:hypothetical protein
MIHNIFGNTLMKLPFIVDAIHSPSFYAIYPVKQFLNITYCTLKTNDV